MTELEKLRAENLAMRNAMEVLANRQKLAWSLRVESPHLTAFVTALVDEMKKYTNIPETEKLAKRFAAAEKIAEGWGAHECRDIEMDFNYRTWKELRK